MAENDLHWVENDIHFDVVFDETTNKWSTYKDNKPFGKQWNTKEYAAKYLRTKEPTILEAENILKELTEVYTEDEYLFDSVERLVMQARNYFKDKRNAKEIYGT